MSDLSAMARSLQTRVKLKQPIDIEQVGILLMRLIRATEEERQESFPLLAPILKQIITPKVARKHKKLLQEVLKVGRKYAASKRPADSERTDGVKDGQDVLETESGGYLWPNVE